MRRLRTLDDKMDSPECPKTVATISPVSLSIKLILLSDPQVAKNFRLGSIANCNINGNNTSRTENVRLIKRLNQS